MGKGNGEWVKIYEKDNNYHRFNSISLEKIKAAALRLNCLETYDSSPARVYEIIVYNE